MINNRRTLSSSSSSLPRRLALYALALVLPVASAACQSSGGSNEAGGVVIVNAPATGEVRRVIAREGMTVDKDAPIVEIAVLEETPSPTPTPGESASARAARSFQTANAEIDAARAEAVRHEAEVQRLTPLVSNGEASPAQLEGERALYERAQQRLQQAKDAKRKAETGLVTSRIEEQQSQGSISNAPPAPREKLVTANASSAGTVSVINARVGQRVKAGQPLATLRTN